MQIKERQNRKYYTAGFFLKIVIVPFFCISLMAEHNITLVKPLTKITPHDGEVGDFFGASVDIYGNTVVIGAYEKDAQTGAVYLYRGSSDGSYDFVQKLVADDGEAGDYFGYSVAIDGDWILVGAKHDNDFEKPQRQSVGSVYVFQKTDEDSYTQTQKLTAPIRMGGDHFGFSIDMDGERAVVGAAKAEEVLQAEDNYGAVYVFERQSDGEYVQTAKITPTTQVEQSCFGWDVGISGESVVVGAVCADERESSASGTAYVFERQSDGNYLEVAHLNGLDSEHLDGFGHTVDIGDGSVIVGASWDDENSGSAYIFEKASSGDYSQIAKLTASDRSTGDLFGYSVKIDGEKIIIAAPWEKESADNGGSVYLFEQSSKGEYVEIAKLIDSKSNTGGTLGYGIGVNSGKIVIGAPGEESNESQGLAALYDVSNIYTFSTQRGWNLAGNPLIQNYNIDNIANKSITWSYQNSTWTQDSNPTACSGFWINATDAEEVVFSGTSCTPDIDSLPEGWNLLGSAQEISISELEAFEYVWSYDGAWYDKSEIETIKPGQGFWVKR